MPTYNPNDFYPRSGMEIKSDGTTANDADGLNADGSRNVQLIGRNVQELTLINALAITDTVTHNSNIFDVSAYGRKCLSVLNLLNQSVTIDVYYIPSAVANGYKVKSFTLAASAFQVYTSADFTGFQDPIPRLKIGLTCATAPTSGTISVYLEGSQN